MRYHPGESCRPARFTEKVPMPFALLFATFALILDLLHTATRDRRDLAVEVVALRQQVRMYQRQATRAPRLARWDKVLLAAILTRYRALASAIVIVQPDTVLRWHREIVKRKWTFGNTPKRGRPTIPAATVELIVRLARENRAWGYGKIQGELLKVGHRVSQATIKRVLRRRGLPPAPRRGRTTWRAFLAQHR
jgi:putative transposase